MHTPATFGLNCELYPCTWIKAFLKPIGEEQAQQCTGISFNRHQVALSLSPVSNPSVPFRFGNCRPISINCLFSCLRVYVTPHMHIRVTFAKKVSILLSTHPPAHAFSRRKRSSLICSVKILFALFEVFFPRPLDDYPSSDGSCI